MPFTTPLCVLSPSAQNGPMGTTSGLLHSWYVSKHSISTSIDLFLAVLYEPSNQEGGPMSTPTPFTHAHSTSPEWKEVFGEARPPILLLVLLC